MTPQERELLKILQEDIPVDPRPFEAIGRRIGMPEEKVLETVSSWEEAGILRRIGTILRHQKAGYDANGMSVWVVPEDRIEAVGSAMITYPEIGHCYQRPTFPGWPYTLFAMIHGKSREEVRVTANRISGDIGITDFDILFTVREFKKISMKFFVEEIPKQ